MIRQQQVQALQLVNPKVHFALLALLVGILQWPDTTFCHHLFAVFPAVGYLAPCGIWATQPVDYLSLSDAFEGSEAAAQHFLAELRHRVPVAEDLDVIYQSGRYDEENNLVYPRIRMGRTRGSSEAFPAHQEVCYHTGLG